MISVNEKNNWTLSIKLENISYDDTLACNTEISTHPLYSIFCSRTAWHFIHLTEFQPRSIPHFYMTNLIILNKAKHAIQTRWEHESSKNVRWHMQTDVTRGGDTPRHSFYTGCPRRKGPNFGRVFLRSNYTDITQNTYIQSSMVTEILAREKCGLLWCLRTVLCPWRHTRIRLTCNTTIMQ